MSAIRVAIVSEFESRLGGENSLLAILPHLMRYGVRPIIVAPDSGDFAAAVRELGVDFIDFRRTITDGVMLSQSEAREALAEALRRISPDLVHANSLAMGRLTGPLVRQLKIPGIAHLRDIVRLNRRAVADINDHVRLLAVSQATRNYHLAQGISAEKCHVVFNGVDQTVFRFRKPTGFLHGELGLPHDAVLVGNIGQIGLRKGQVPLLLAMQQVVEARPQTHLIVVGKRWSSKAESVEYERALHDLAARPPLQGHVHFIGLRHDVPAILNELTLLLHTARQEPLGRVLLEAAASQIPVMATDVGGTREIFAPLKSQRPAAVLLGNPASKSDIDLSREISMQTISLLDNTALRNELARQARQIVENRFSTAESANAVYSHYQLAIADFVNGGGKRNESQSPESMLHV